MSGQSPDENRAVLRGTHEPLAAREEGDGVDRPVVAAERTPLLAAGRLQQVDGVILPGDRQDLSVGREGERAVTVPTPQHLAGPEVPESNRLPTPEAERHQPLAVRGEGRGGDGAQVLAAQAQPWQRLAGARIPEPRAALVVLQDRQCLAIRREDDLRAGADRPHLLAGRHVPDLERLLLLALAGGK